jgi:drug/metabolite transporter (DMT)-like permease
MGLGFLGMLLFAGTLPAMKLAIPPLDPWFLTIGRAALAGVAAMTMLMVLRRPLPPPETWWPLTVASLCLVIGVPAFSALAMTSVPAGHAGVVFGILPLATATAAATFAGERPSLGFWLAGLVGAALVVAFVLYHGGAGGLAPGDLLLFGAVASAAIGYTFSGRLSRTMPGWETICWALVLLLPFSLAAAWLTLPPDLSAIPARAWGGFLYNAIASQFLGFFAWNAAMAIAGIARVGQLQLLQPFTIIALAAMLNNEAVDGETLVFALAVVAVVMIGQRMQVRRAPS